MVKPVTKVKVGELIKADKMNEIIASINELEKRLAKLEGKTPKRMIPEKETPKVKDANSKIPKVKTPGKKTPKRNTTKTNAISHIDSVK